MLIHSVGTWRVQRTEPDQAGSIYLRVLQKAQSMDQNSPKQTNPLKHDTVSLDLVHLRHVNFTAHRSQCMIHFLNSLSLPVSILLTAPIYAEAWCPLLSEFRCKRQAHESSGIHYSAIQVNPSLFLLISSTIENVAFNDYHGLDM